MLPADVCITALIPTYHRAALLHRAVRSVLAQTHRNLRVVVCDNASEDATPEVMADLMRQDARVVYFRHQKNHGSVYNFRFARSKVETDWFSILSDDDLLLPTFYERAAWALAANPDIGLYASQVYTFSEETGRAGLRPQRLWRDGLHPAGALAPTMLREHFTWTGCVFSRAVSDQIGEFDGVPMIDVLYLLKACAVRPFVVDLFPGAVFVKTGANNSAFGGLDAARANFDAASAIIARLDPATVPVTEVTAALRELFTTVGSGALRHASATGDSALAAEAEAFLASIGAGSARRSAQAGLVRRGGLGRSLLRIAMRARAGYRRFRQSLKPPDTIAKLLARHADSRTVAWIMHTPLPHSARPVPASDTVATEANRRLL